MDERDKYWDDEFWVPEDDYLADEDYPHLYDDEEFWMEYDEEDWSFEPSLDDEYYAYEYGAVD